MPWSPPQTQTKPVLRFRNVWLTWNKTMLCFYTSCFQQSLQAGIQNMAGRALFALFLAQLKPGRTGNLTKPALAHRVPSIPGLPLFQYNITHVHMNLVLISYQVTVMNKFPWVPDTRKPHFYFTVAAHYLHTLKSFYAHPYGVIGIAAWRQDVSCGTRQQTAANDNQGNKPCAFCASYLVQG